MRYPCVLMDAICKTLLSLKPKRMELSFLAIEQIPLEMMKREMRLIWTTGLLVTLGEKSGRKRILQNNTRQQRVRDREPFSRILLYCIQVNYCSEVLSSFSSVAENLVRDVGEHS